MTKQERLLAWLLWSILALCILTGLAVQGVGAAVRGVWELQVHPARLINDFTGAAGEGGALVNAALVAAIGLALVHINRIRLSGPTVAAVFTMLGFGLFGKTPVNIVPVIMGVYLSGRLVGKRFNEYILIALFGTALGPLVTLLAVEAGLPVPMNLFAAAAGGIAAGMLLPPLALIMLRLHQGFNLYNIGLTSGFFALFVAAIVSAASGAPDPGRLWNDDPSAVLVFLVPALSALLLAACFLMDRRRAYGGFMKILRMPGRLPSDFMETGSIPGGLLNMGLMGTASWLYVLIVGGSFNGPVLGGILTIIGFAAFGKHPRNTWPVLAGIVGATLLFGKDPAAPGPLLAALFGTTLAPLAGEFGPLIGMIAGFLHLVMVERTGAWHMGMNLYNNGFAGGLTATFLVAVIEWYRSNRSTPVSAASRSSMKERKGVS